MHTDIYYTLGRIFLLQPAIFALQYKIGSEISGIGRSNLTGGDFSKQALQKNNSVCILYTALWTYF
jgi:hypothetical protein